MVQKQDLQNFVVVITATSGAIQTPMSGVPKDFTRNFVFLKYNNPLGSDVDVEVDAIYGTSVIPLDKQYVVAKDTVSFPQNPDTEQPIFSIKQSGYMQVVTSLSGARITGQFYDTY